VGFLATPGSNNPEEIATKLPVRNYVVDSTLTFKYGSDQAVWVDSGMHEISLFVSVCICVPVCLSVCLYVSAGLVM